MNKKLLIIAIITFVLISCKKIEVIPTEPFYVEYDSRDQFLGDYKVYDTAYNYLYDCQISEMGGGCPDGSCDSLLITNFADTFDIRVRRQNYVPENYIDLGSHHPIIDYAGNQWHLNSLWGAEYNLLSDDTIFFYFKMNNMAFYLEDWVPYYDCDCKHIAVKLN